MTQPRSPGAEPGAALPKPLNRPQSQSEVPRNHASLLASADSWHFEPPSQQRPIEARRSPVPRVGTGAGPPAHRSSVVPKSEWRFPRRKYKKGLNDSGDLYEVWWREDGGASPVVFGVPW